jgi:5-oxoprolinase (ATP-hydrolysing)
LAVATVPTRGRAHLRYEGSHQTLEVAFGTPQEMAARFDAAHMRALRLRAARAKARSSTCCGRGHRRRRAGPNSAKRPTPGRAAKPDQTRPVPRRGRLAEAALYDRDRAGSGQRFRRPSDRGRATGTTVVEPGWRARPDALGNLVLERRRTLPARDRRSAPRPTR